MKRNDGVAASVMGVCWLTLQRALSAERLQATQSLTARPYNWIATKGEQSLWALTTLARAWISDRGRAGMTGSLERKASMPLATGSSSVCTTALIGRCARDGCWWGLVPCTSHARVGNKGQSTPPERNMVIHGVTSSENVAL